MPTFSYSGHLLARLLPHQNPVAADLWIPPMHCYENAVDFCSQRIKSTEAGNPQHSHWKALEESTNPQPEDFGVPVALRGKSLEINMYLSKSMKVLASICTQVPKVKVLNI